MKKVVEFFRPMYVLYSFSWIFLKCEKSKYFFGGIFF